MVNTNTLNLEFITPRLTFGQIFCAFLLALVFIFSIFAQDNLSKNSAKETVKAQEGEDVYRYNKNVLVEKGIKAKSILAFGGDIIIEGEVEEDVATIGGTINQKESAVIGGDTVIKRLVIERKAAGRATEIREAEIDGGNRVRPKRRVRSGQRP